MPETEQIKTAVKEFYRTLATKSQEPSSVPKVQKLVRYGYSQEELNGLPESVIVMADGCGNPTGLGMIEEGDTVLDLGSGGGIDVFLASKKVGPQGRVIGLDMTPEMIHRAVDNARKMSLTNVEFRLGEIEQIPLGDERVDVIMSNCVICLSPNKAKVFQEMFRVLKPGGRLAIADEIAAMPFSPEEKANSEKWCECITGAITEEEYTSTLKDLGFANVYVKRLRPTGDFSPGIFSAFVSAVKPTT